MRSTLGLLRRVHVTVPVVVMALGLAACGSSTSGASPSSTSGASPSSTSGASPSSTSAAPHSHEPLVGIVMPSNAIPWFTTVESGMRSESIRLHVRLDITNANLDPSTEAHDLQELVLSHTGAIAISALNSVSSVPAIVSAAKHVPIVEWNNTLNSSVPKSFVGINNYKYGLVAGTAARKYIQTKMAHGANIAILNEPGAQAINQRVNGFIAGLGHLANVKIVTTQPGFNPEPSLSTVESILAAHPDVNIVFASNEGGALGAVKAIQAEHSKAIVVGLDIDKVLAQDLTSPGNPLKIVVTQNPYKIGEETVKIAALVAEHKTVPRQVLVPIQVITPGNIAAYLSETRVPS